MNGGPRMAGTPFILAIQGFQIPAAMTRIVPAATELTFGVRHYICDGRRRIEWIERHAYGEVAEQSGFIFRCSGAENVSALLTNLQGTLTKFNPFVLPGANHEILHRPVGSCPCCRRGPADIIGTHLGQSGRRQRTARPGKAELA